MATKRKWKNVTDWINTPTEEKEVSEDMWEQPPATPPVEAGTGRKIDARTGKPIPTLEEYQQQDPRSLTDLDIRMLEENQKILPMQRPVLSPNAPEVVVTNVPTTRDAAVAEGKTVEFFQNPAKPAAAPEPTAEAIAKMGPHEYYNHLLKGALGGKSKQEYIDMMAEEIYQGATKNSTLSPAEQNKMRAGAYSEARKEYNDIEKDALERAKVKETERRSERTENAAERRHREAMTARENAGKGALEKDISYLMRLGMTQDEALKARNKVTGTTREKFMLEVGKNALGNDATEEEARIAAEQAGKIWDLVNGAQQRPATGAQPNAPAGAAKKPAASRFTIKEVGAATPQATPAPAPAAKAAAEPAPAPSAPARKKLALGGDNRPPGISPRDWEMMSEDQKEAEREKFKIGRRTSHLFAVGTANPAD